MEQGIRGVREGEDGARNKRCEGGRERVEQGIRGGREGGRERVEQGIRGVREGEGGARNKRCEGGRGWSKEV